jgi:hypothetical protein
MSRQSLSDLFAARPLPSVVLGASQRLPLGLNKSIYAFGLSAVLFTVDAFSEHWPAFQLFRLPARRALGLWPNSIEGSNPPAISRRHACSPADL